MMAVHGGFTGTMKHIFALVGANASTAESRCLDKQTR